MTRKTNDQLIAANEDLLARNDQLECEAREFEATIGELTEQLEKLKADREWQMSIDWQTVARENKAEFNAQKERTNLIAKENDDLREQLLQQKLAAAGERAERLRVQGYVEGVLDGLHPPRPRLPWAPEGGMRGRYEHVGNVGQFEFERL